MSKKELEIYEILGARLFQKVVLKVEKIKYKILRPFAKWVIKYYDKQVDKKVYRLLKKIKDESKRKNIILYYQKEKLLFHKEITLQQNRNYHLDMMNPNQTLAYLKMNKQIHQKGVIANLFQILLSMGIMVIFSGIISLGASIYLVMQGIALIINFECINLQNYNIKRLEMKMTQLEKIKNHKLKRKNDEYGKVIEILAPLLERSVELPTKEDIISEITTLEQLKQMKNMIEELQQQNIPKSKEKTLM